MAALLPTTRPSFSTSRNNKIRIPAWAMARRLSKHSATQDPASAYSYYKDSPDSMAKKTVQTLPTVVDEDDCLALPRMGSKHANKNQDQVPATKILFQMDVTGFQVDDLHVEVNVATRQLFLAARAPRMFKRSFALETQEGEELVSAAQLQAHYTEKEGRYFLVILQLLGKEKGGDDADDNSTLSSVVSSEEEGGGRQTLAIQHVMSLPTHISFGN